VVLSDINAAMLSEGRKNLINKGVSGVQFVQLSGEQIPFADNTFDC
jgi:demethylmenaquinone methyltransferase/2-methoxy-6-polyprenyl-1,4-benzoquinol methylase